LIFLYRALGPDVAALFYVAKVAFTVIWGVDRLKDISAGAKQNKGKSAHLTNFMDTGVDGNRTAYTL
jgi:hypothetical protein